MAVYGRKPGTNDIGVGHMAAGQARGSIMGRPSSSGWVYAFGGRVGKQPGGSNATYYEALYGVSGSSIASLVGSSVAGIAAAVMDYGGSGSNQTVKPTAPIKIHNTTTYALVTRVSSGDFAHGQDHSGHPMHERTGAGSSFPSPFNASAVSPQGKMSLWVEYQPNRKPDTPSGHAPAPGAFVTSTPTLAVNFRDPDETLPGFTVGQADKVSKYRFEIWNSARTSRLRDSGVLNATTAQQSARRVTWTPATLPADRYIAMATVWDQFDVPSTTTVWSFTISAGGAVEDVHIRPSHVAGETPQHVVTNRTGGAEDTLQFFYTWQHANNLNTSQVAARVLTSAGAIYRSEVVWSGTVTPGSEVGITIGATVLAGWAPLTRNGRYYFQLRAQDSAGLWTSWSSSPLFIVNPAPNAPTVFSPASGGVTGALPVLSVVVRDANDDPAALTPEFEIRPQGGSATTIPAGTYQWSGYWHRAEPSAAEMPTHGVYEWRARATDPWGLAGPWSDWQILTYAEPPAVTMTAPSGTITTGTPTITGTVDRAITAFVVDIRDDATGQLVYTSGTVNTSGTAFAHTVPVATLRNTTTYVVTVTVTSTLGLTGTGVETFTVEYVQPPALAELIAEPAPGPFEPDAAPGAWSRIILDWPEVTVAQVPDEEFAGYIVRRENLSTGEREALAVLPARDDTLFVDRMPASGVAYQYSVAYLTVKNNLDTVESLPVSAATSVTLRTTVLVTLDDDDIGVPLHYWEERAATPVREWEIVPSFGRTPVAFQGMSDYRTVTGTFIAVNDRHGTYTAQDIREAIERMSAPVREDDGSIRARILGYRDPLGRVLTVVMERVEPQDHHQHDRATIALSLTEVDAVTTVESAP